MNNSKNTGAKYIRTISTPVELEVFEKLNNMHKEQRVPVTQLVRHAIDMFLKTNYEVQE